MVRLQFPPAAESLQPEYHISAGKRKKVKFLGSRMNRPVLLVPFPEPAVFLHDAQPHNPAALLPCGADSMPEQSGSDSLMPVFRQHGEAAQFTFAVILQEQRIISSDHAVLIVRKHQPVFTVHMPGQPVLVGGKGHVPWRVFRCKTEFVRHGLMAAPDHPDAFRDVFPIDFPDHVSFLPGRKNILLQF